MADFTVEYSSGTLDRLTPLTQAAKDWIEEFVSTEGYQWLGQSLCIEPRYTGPIVQGMLDAGLEQG